MSTEGYPINCPEEENFRICWQINGLSAISQDRRFNLFSLETINEGLAFYSSVVGGKFSLHEGSFVTL
jgi:hypothetical protein